MLQQKENAEWGKGIQNVEKGGVELQLDILRHDSHKCYLTFMCIAGPLRSLYYEKVITQV